MKLRIRGNSVRLRLSKSELVSIAESGSAEDTVRFAPGAELRYRVETKPGGAVEAQFAGPLLRVVVPQPQIDRWLEPTQVSIVGQQPIGDGQMLRILVEKDYTCLAPRPGEAEDDADLFANPQKKSSRD